MKDFCELSWLKKKKIYFWLIVDLQYNVIFISSNTSKALKSGKLLKDHKIFWKANIQIYINDQYCWFCQYGEQRSMFWSVSADHPVYWDDKHSQSLIRDAKLLSGNHEDVFAIEPSQLWWQHQQDFDYSLKFYTFFYFPFLFISHDWRISDDVSGTLATSSFTTKNLATAFNIKHIRVLLIGG